VTIVFCRTQVLSKNYYTIYMIEYKKTLKRIKKKIEDREKKISKRVIPKIEDYYNDLDYCLCTDRNHNFKKIYATEVEAEKQAKFLQDEQGIFLIVYPCPYSSGWHLSRG